MQLKNIIYVFCVAALLAMPLVSHGALQSLPCTCATGACSTNEQKPLSGACSTNDTCVAFGPTYTCFREDASEGAGKYYCQCEPKKNANPVTIPGFTSPTNTQSFNDFVCNITNLASGQLLPRIAVLMMLVVGFLFMISGGDPGRANNAKRALFFTLAGVFLLLLAPGIVALISDIFSGFSVTPISCSGSVVTNTIINTLVGLVNWFSWFVAIVSVAMGLWGGILYITSQGKPEQVARASRVLAFTVVGIAVSIVAFGIIAVVKQFL